MALLTMVERDPAMTGRRTIKFKIRSRLSSQTVNDNHQKKTVVELKQSNSSTTGRRQATCVMAIVLGGWEPALSIPSGCTEMKSEYSTEPPNTRHEAQRRWVDQSFRIHVQKTGFLFIGLGPPPPPGYCVRGYARE